MTNNLVKRVWQHKNELADGFTKKYHLHKLVYYEAFNTAMEAIIREKQIKDMNRDQKLRMIKERNPTMSDLYDEMRQF